MAVRYKFRSAVNFDSVDIDGRPSISIRDLKSKIVHSKKLNICEDFDLVFSDALTGQEYSDENVQILSNSCVIIKRVPAGSVPPNLARNGISANLRIKDTKKDKISSPLNAEINFDDFGVDLCPLFEPTLSCPDIDSEKKTFIDNDIKNINVTSCLAQPTVGCQKLDVDLIESVPRGTMPNGVEENASAENLKLEVQRFMGLGKANNGSPAMQDANFLSELKCSLCNTFFKDAVMIPCCQQSFCKKCIHLVLDEKRRCPMCFSSKCRKEDLLPNIALRQAIEHFLESQNLSCGLENPFNQYVPDGESGIQAGDVPYPVTACQRNINGLPDSPCSTGRGSNEIVDSHNEKKTLVGVTISSLNQLGGDKSLKPCPLPLKRTKIEGKKHGSVHLVESKPVDLADISGFKGESKFIHEEAASNIKRGRSLWTSAPVTNKSFAEYGRHKKGAKTCYMCGSPDHFVRNCPAALTSNLTNQIGAPGNYASSYWNGPPLPHAMPFSNCYGYPEMMLFQSNQFPVSPFPVPAYMPSIRGGLPGYGGWRAPVENCSGFLSLQDYEEKQKLLNHSLSGWSFDDEDDANKKRHSDEAERLHHMKSCKSMERHISNSGNGFAHRRHQHEPNLDANDISNNRKQEKFSRSPVSGRAHRGHCWDSHLDNDNYSVDEEREKNSHSSTAARARRRYQHDISSDHGSHSHDKEHEKGSRSSIIGKERRPYHNSNRLSSDVEDMPSGYSCYGDDEYRSHIRSSRKHNERTHQYPCDSTQGHHRADVERDAMRKSGNSVVKRYSWKNSCTESDLESDYLSDPDEQQKQIDFGHGCTHYGLNSRPKHANPRRDRWLMVKDSNEDVEDHSRYKRKRVY